MSSSEGRLNSPRSKKQDAGRQDGTLNVALVVGVTGIVGCSLSEILPRPDTPGGPWKVYGVARRPRPDWFAEAGVVYIRCDVHDREETLEKLSVLKEVTHLFWVAWADRKSEEENCEYNGQMLRNVLDALLANAPNFQHVCLQTGAKHYKGPFNYSGEIRPHEPPFHEDMPRLPVPNFYYTLEDILLEFAKKKEGLSWSVHRPGAIFGFSPVSAMNLLRTLCAYAIICKRESLPFRYPGNRITWEEFSSVSDADLIAEQEIWAATEPDAKNEAFNITNGDVINFKRIWKLLGDKFEVEVPPYSGEPFSLEHMMKDKGDEMGNWWFADLMLNSRVVNLVSMNKSKEFGFLGFCNTEASLLHWIERMQEANSIPSAV